MRCAVVACRSTRRDFRPRWRGSAPKPARQWAGSGEAATEGVWYGLRERIGATEFLGYATERSEGIVTALLADGVEVDRLEAGQRGLVMLNQTPFYGESGGQVGDMGVMTAPGVLLRVTDTARKLGDVFVHEVSVEEGEVVPGLALDLVVDHARRRAIRANHSATHLLHEALRQVLGPHVAQKGSLVDPERLRFDFSHQKPISDAELAAVEDLVNAVVLDNEPVVTRLMGLDEARASGARALFGEKYGDEVRVVSMGHPRDGEATPWSIELCGGTHAARTGDIGLISVVGESSVASGVRRIEARTGTAARQHLNTEAARLKGVAQMLKSTPEAAGERLQALIEERRRLDREVADARKRLAMGGGEAATAAPSVREVAGVKFFGPRRDRGRDEGPQGARRRSQDGGRLGRCRHRGRRGGRQGRHRGGRDAGPDRSVQRRGAGAGWLRQAGRQGWRRPARHGAGRRP